MYEKQYKSTVLRFSQCYGIGEKDTPVLMKFIKQANEKQKIIAQDNEFYLDEIYIKDVIDAILLVVNKETEGTFNIGGGKAYSILEMAETVNLIFNNEKILKLHQVSKNIIKATFYRYKKLKSI